MSHHAKHGGGRTSLPVTNADGSITCEGYTIPRGSAQHDDIARLRGHDPKAPYLIVSRYQGDQAVCRRWPGFAAQAGLGGRP